MDISEIVWKFTYDNNFYIGVFLEYFMESSSVREYCSHFSGGTQYLVEIYQADALKLGQITHIGKAYKVGEVSDEGEVRASLVEDLKILEGLSREIVKRSENMKKNVPHLDVGWVFGNGDSLR